jgi:hypothetical protein
MILALGPTLEVIPKKIACKHFELEEVLLPLLLGRVFHVTTEATFDRICQLGRIYSNQEVEFALTLGHSKNCYGRKRGWVSLFDLSHTADAHIKEALIRYWFLRSIRNENTHVYLFIAESAWQSLISWKRASREVGATEVFIPFVEAWYPGDIPIELVSDSLMVTVDPA